MRLVDLYRQCHARCEEVAQRYAGSEVERAARELQQEIDGDLAGLEQDLDRDEVARLQSILAALEAQEASALAQEVRSYLETRFPD